MDEISLDATLSQLTLEEQKKVKDRITNYEKVNNELRELAIGGYINDIFLEYNGGNKEGAQYMAEFSFPEDVNLLVPKVLKGTLQELYKDRLVYKQKGM